MRRANLRTLANCETNFTEQTLFGKKSVWFKFFCCPGSREREGKVQKDLGTSQATRDEIHC